MLNLLTVDSFVAAQRVEQQWPDPGALSAEHINPVDIANKDRLFRPGLCSCKGKVEDARIRLLGGNQVAVDYPLEELFDAGPAQDRGDAARGVRDHSQNEAAI